MGVQQNPWDIGYLFSPPPHPPSLPGPSCTCFISSQRLYLRPRTQAGGELLVKQPLQRFQGREGPDDFSGGRRQGEGQALVRTSVASCTQAPAGDAVWSHPLWQRQGSFAEGQAQAKIQTCQSNTPPTPACPPPGPHWSRDAEI